MYGHAYIHPSMDGSMHRSIYTYIHPSTHPYIYTHNSFVHDPKSPNSQPASLYFGAGTGYERKQQVRVKIYSFS